MKGEISKEGNLKIMRGNKMQYQNCPKTIETGQVQPYNPCGDWCPHFGEPENINPNETRIEICHGKVLKFTELEDKRTYQKEATGGNS